MIRHSHGRTRWVLLWASAAPFLALHGKASDLDEFKVKRQEVFEFTEQPKLTREGDRVTITFASKGYCDATVAIENAEGKIVRHLASGVLGPKAPAPFQKDALTQTLVWDGKDDQEKYVDGKENLTVRVSLGLKPEFERTLFWSPHKVIGINPPLIAAAPEGVYVFEGSGMDSVRLYDHAGNFLRTIYPFSREKLAQVKGLDLQVFPQDGAQLPVKQGTVHATLLTSGDNVTHKRLYSGDATMGAAGLALAAQDGRVALVGHRLNRLSADGTTGGQELGGPETGIAVPGHDSPFVPRSAAFSPDGRRLYLTSYMSGSYEYLHAVMSVDWAGSGKAEVFAGSVQRGAKDSGTQGFRVPTAVACDKEGRVYVADYMNDRIQVFESGKFLKSIPIKSPAWIAVHQKTGEIYAASWFVLNSELRGDLQITPAVSRLGTLNDPKVLATYPLPLIGHQTTAFMNHMGNLQFRLALDSWSEAPAIWLFPGHFEFIKDGNRIDTGKSSGLRILVEKGGNLAEQRNFDQDVATSVVRTKPSHRGWSGGPRQGIVVNPLNGRLFIGEADGKYTCKQLLELAPETGKVSFVDLPLAARGITIDLNGHFYLVGFSSVGRFEADTWREIPWDYGEDVECGGHRLISGLVLPGAFSASPAVSPKGHLAVTCIAYADPKTFIVSKGVAEKTSGKKYTPKLYHGRAVDMEVHVWDKHGKVIYDDAVPGLQDACGLGMDKDDNLYAMTDSNRVLDGKPYFLDSAHMLIKAAPKKCRVITSKTHGGVDQRTPPPPMLLGPENRPLRAPDGISNCHNRGTQWYEGVDWFYGGVGDAMWGNQWALDLFARSFLPELDRFSVAVLDSNGNLILRVGKYGNVEDGKPLVLAGGPAHPRSIGGNEVALFHASYVGSHSDRRLYIADAGNQRILSVKLGYHAQALLRLADTPDLGVGRSR